MATFFTLIDQKKNNLNCLINQDKKLLTFKEVLFEKYYQGKFDQAVWMKKARIRF